MKQQDDRTGISAEDSNAGNGPELRRDGGELVLTGNGRTVRADFTRLLPRIKPARLRGELLVRAAKIRDAGEQPLAVDATAGLGEDAFLLAAAGFTVKMYEKDAVIAALLRDALERGKDSPELAPVVARMQLYEEDSTAALCRMETAPDVVLLDPMFPVRQKSGLIKKKFQLLQKLEQPSADEEAELLQAALAASPRRIVIKRPLKGPYLAGRQPDYSLCGTAIRYDCILVGQKQSGSTAAAGFGQADSTDADAAESGQDDCTQKCRSVAKDDPLMLEYHDRRWCRPCHDDRELFAMFCLEGQQAGLSWSTIIHKEKAIREAFDGFDIRTVAGYDSGKVEELMNVPGIIRSRSKIRAAVHNAGIVCGMLSSGEYASFDEYVWHFTGGRQIIHHLHELSEMPAKNELSEEVSRDMKKRGFLFAGPVICYSYLQGIGVIDDHLDGCSCKAKPQKK